MTAPGALAEARSREDIFASLAILVQKEFGFQPDAIRLGTDLIDDLRFEHIMPDLNNPFEYLNKINLMHTNAINNKTPVLVEVKVTTLGYWYLKNEDYPEGKFINYHAGPAPKVNENIYPIIEASNDDPLHVLVDYLSMEDLVTISKELQKELKDEIL